MADKIIKFIKNTCTYTVMMITVLYIFSLIMQFQDSGINLAKFALVLLFGTIIAAADFIFKLKKIGKPLQVLLHYCVLLFSFIAVFTWSGMLGKTSNAFISFFVFTFFYFLVLGLAELVKYSAKKTKNTDKRSQKEASPAQKKSTYKSRFNDLND